MRKAIWNGESNPMQLTQGVVYNVISVEDVFYRVVDNSGEDYLYLAEMFTLVN